MKPPQPPPYAKIIFKAVALYIAATAVGVWHDKYHDHSPD